MGKGWKIFHPYEGIKSVVLCRGERPPGGVKKFPGGREPLHVLQHGKFLDVNVALPNVMPVLTLRRYMLFGLVPVDMEVRIKLLKILQAEFESEYKHSGVQLELEAGAHAGIFKVVAEILRKIFCSH